MSDQERLTAALSDTYAIQRELGRGGMATVYLADDLKHGRQVAIKVLHPDLAAGLGTERFLREVETAARLHHPHILPLYDSGEADGFLYYVMPYVAGESLGERLDKEKQLPVDDALRITREVADALQYAHDNDVLHRDIKPDNIMLGGGHAMVADFGVARAITAAGGETLTSTGLAVGTPTYMSPEQAAAEKGIDGRSDLYSLGCLLYEMLAGEPPHTGATAQAIIARRLSEPAPSLRAVRESVPEAVHQALAQALARAPADRHGSVVEFVDALDQEAVPAPEEPSRSSAKTKVLAAVGAVALLLVGYFVIGGRLGEPIACGPTGAEPGVAVLPFSVIGDDIEFLDEGMVHLLSFNLDGVAGIRKIDPQAVLYAWGQIVGDDGADPSPGSALEVACRVGARYAITGSVVQLGPEVRITAEVHDVDRKQSRGSAPVVGRADSVSALVDELTLELLRLELVPTEDTLHSVNLSRVTTASLDALKAYLAGEQKYRRARWEAAAEDFRRAVELDSTFARAMYRLSVAYAWLGQYGLSSEMAISAARFATGLPERDSLLVVGNADFTPASIPTLQRLTSRYPDDVDGWYALGESFFHYGGVAFHTAADFTSAFERALDLRAYYGESYAHTIEDAFARLDSARVRKLVTAYHALDPDDPPCPGYRVVMNLAWGTETDSQRAVAALDTIPWEGMQYCAWTTIAVSQQALKHVERSDLARKDLRDSRLPRILNLFRMLQARTMRGQIKAAYRVIEETGTNPLIEADAARFAMMFHLSGFPDTASARWGAEIMARVGDYDDHFWLGAQAAAGGRWDDVDRAATALDARAIELSTEGDAVKAGFAQANAEALRGYAELLRGNTERLPEFEEAMLRLAPMGLSSESVAYYLRYKVGQMLFDEGRLRDAERYFRSFYQYQWMYLVPSHSYLGRIYEELDRPDDAAYHYGLFVEWWRDADPELRDWWEEGRDALARVTGEPRQ